MNPFIPDEIVAALQDLHKQATEEHSHYYTGGVIRRAIVEIEHLRKLLAKECRRAEDAHGESLRASLEIEHLRNLAAECGATQEQILECIR